MQLLSLEAKDFRNIVETFVEPDPDGTTVLSGLNGAGKTSVLEAVYYLSTLRSFRRAPRDVMVRRGAECAIVRAVVGVDDRTISIEAEITAAGRARTLVNRQPVRRRADLHDALRATLFSPEDIGVVRGGPAERRQFLDDAVGILDIQAARGVDEVEKIVRQRTALLRAASRRLRAEEVTTLDVWDARLDEIGHGVGRVTGGIGRGSVATGRAALLEARWNRGRGRTRVPTVVAGPAARRAPTCP